MATATPNAQPAGQTSTQDLAAVLTGTAATGTVATGDLSNGAFRGIKIVFDVTAVVGAGSFTVKVEGKDAASGKYYPLLAGAAVAAAATNVYTVYPGLPATANVSAN